MVFCNIKQYDILNTEDFVTILILIDGFLQCNIFVYRQEKINKVTILILIDGFLQYTATTGLVKSAQVTILILIDGFLQ